jgi:hypothetical protein
MHGIRGYAAKKQYSWAKSYSAKEETKCKYGTKLDIWETKIDEPRNKTCVQKRTNLA